MSSEPPPSAPFVLRTTVSERRLGIARWLALGAFAAIFGPSLLAFACSFFGDLLGILLLHSASTVISNSLGSGFFWGLISAFSSALVAGPTVRAWRGATEVSVDSTGLVFRRNGQEHSIARAKIRDAAVLTTPTTGIELWLANGNTLTLELASEQEANAVLAQLGFSPSERRVTIRLGTPQRQLTAGCVALPLIWILLLPMTLLFLKIGIASMGIGAFFTLAPALLTMLFYRWYRPPEVVIGTEGVQIRRAFSKKYFPYASLGLVVADGGSLKFGELGQMDTVARGDKALVNAAAKRIADARAVYELAASESTLGELLDVGGRDVEEWKKAILALARQEGYRKITLSPEALSAVVENPEVSARRRLSAAMLLRIASPEARPRIRIAAEACAGDELREALVAAAAEQEELDLKKLEPVITKRLDS